MAENLTPTDEANFDRLASAYLDGSISAAEIAELESRLHSDDQFADRFARWCLMHRHVYELLTEGTLHEMMEQFITGSPALPKKAISQMASAARGKSDPSPNPQGPIIPPLPSDSPASPPSILQMSQFIWRKLLVPLAAAAIILGAAAWWSYRRPTSDAALAEAEHQRAANVDVVGTLTQVVDGVWSSGAAKLTPGQLLGKDTRVALKSGMAKVTFDCGAEVVLQGPCDFVLQSQMVGFLKSGKITANVPKRAFSFTILSPQVDFVDLGTAFGVSIGASGKTELHVFEGEVLCSPSKAEAADRKDPIHVTAANALAFDTTSSQPSNIAINKEQFSPLIDLRRVSGKLEKLVPDHLALWLAADAGVTTDHGRVIAWQDILYGDNRSAEDATQNDPQARPTLASNALNGRPAVRFNGKSDYLLTTPLETTDDQTVIFVCQFSQSAYDKNRVWGGQIINYDGPPSRYLSNTLEPGVLQIGEPLLAEEFKPTLLTGQVFAGFVGSATVESGRVDSQQVGADLPVIVVYQYDYALGRATLWINGRNFGETRAFAPQAITSRKIIGRHAWKQNFFHGDLAELLIYNKSLSSKELADTTSYLSDKYSIDVGTGVGGK